MPGPADWFVAGADMAEIRGTTSAAFEAVRTAFAANFDEHGDIGAGVAVYHHGVPVVDLTGGVVERGGERPYDESTLQLVFSTTKGAAAVCVARLVDQGRLDPSAAVADYWPEFAAQGKEAITVEQLLSHRAGLAAIEPVLSVDDVCAVEPVVQALAGQAPLWEPDSTHGYHALTYGWLAGELVRRVDGRTIGTFFAEEVAAPLGLDFWIGLPEAEESRVAPLIAGDPPSEAADIELMLKIAGPGTLGFRALFLNGTLFAMGEETPFNTRAVHATEMPAANGITNAASLARMYAACIGEVDGCRLFSADTMETARRQRSHGPDHVLFMESAFGLGFGRHSELFNFGGTDGFGHYGAGGSVGFADPESGLAFGYVMNRMSTGLGSDPRTDSLIAAALAAARS
ncbi:MAG: serine hydrolase domain-containing protein [Acidimicrobiales bacterium]